MLIEILTRVQGTAPERGQNDECGAGPLEFAHWKDGLSVNMQEGNFVGWWVDQGEPPGDAAARLTTIGGIGIGATRAELEAVHAVEVTETTLGTEFSAGELFGLLDSAKPEARITAIWAGTSCVFR